MNSTRYAPNPTKLVRDYLQGQYDSVSPHNMDLMKYLDDLVDKTADEESEFSNHFPPLIKSIIVNTSMVMGKDPTFYNMSLLTLASVMFRGTIVQFNGTERNNLTLYA